MKAILSPARGKDVCRRPILRRTENAERRIVICSQRRGIRAQADGAGGKRISQEEFTEKAWLAIVSAPAIAKRYSQQVVETEHMFKFLLEEPNGLARRIVSKAGSNASRLLDKTEAFIKQQPKVSGDSAQVNTSRPYLLEHWRLASIGMMLAMHRHEEAYKFLI